DCCRAQGTAGEDQRPRVVPEPARWARGCGRRCASAEASQSGQGEEGGAEVSRPERRALGRPRARAALAGGAREEGQEAGELPDSPLAVGTLRSSISDAASVPVGTPADVDGAPSRGDGGRYRGSDFFAMRPGEAPEVSFPRQQYDYSDEGRDGGDQERGRRARPFGNLRSRVRRDHAGKPADEIISGGRNRPRRIGDLE